MLQNDDQSYVRTEMALPQPAPRQRAWAGRPGLRKNLFATPVDTVLTILGLLIVAGHTAAAPELGLHQRAMDRHRSHRLRDGGAGRHPARWLVRRLLGLRQRQVRPVHVRPLSGRRALAGHPGGIAVRGAAGADADPARAAQGPERDPALRGLPGRRLHPAGRRHVRPAACRDPAVGRPAGDAGAVLRRHRRVAAARHRAGARPALEDAGGQDAVRRSSSRSCAACR